MFRRAILWVTHPPLLWVRAGGISVLERQLFTIARAGLKTVWVAAHEPAAGPLRALRVPPDLTLRWASHKDGALAVCQLPYLGVSADHFVRVETLAFIARERFETSANYEDAEGLGVIQVVLDHVDSAGRRKRPLPTAAYRRLRGWIETDELLDWLMAVGPKRQDGFMARHFDRHLSLAASRALLDTPLTPNQMTAASTVLGLAGTLFFLGSTRLHYVLGALLIWLHSVLDGCDGELARVRFQESSLGADLDFWGDNIVHLALFSALGLGFWLGGAGPHALALSALADAGVLASAWTAWRHRLRRRASGDGGAEAGVIETAGGQGLDSRLSRLENALAQRDFIYLLVLLAFLDCVYEFLWAAAIGGLLYFCIMLYLGRVNEHGQARQPHPAR